MRVLCDQKLKYFFLGKWILVSNLNHKLTDLPDVSGLEDIPSVLLDSAEIRFLELDKALSDRSGVIVNQQSW